MAFMVPAAISHVVSATRISHATGKTEHVLMAVLMGTSRQIVPKVRMLTQWMFNIVYRSAYTIIQRNHFIIKLQIYTKLSFFHTRIKKKPTTLLLRLSLEIQNMSRVLERFSHRLEVVQMLQCV